MARNVSGVYSLPSTISNGDDGDATDLMAILNDMETDHNDVFALDYDNTVTGDNTFSGTQTFTGTLDVSGGTLVQSDLTVAFLGLESGLSRLVTDNGLDGVLLRAGSVYDTNDTRDEYTAAEGAVTLQLDYEAVDPAFYVRFAPTGTADAAITYDTYFKVDINANMSISSDGVEELAFDAVVEEFETGDTVTGTSSSATADIIGIRATSLLVNNRSGTFTDNEQITGAVQGDALANIPGGVVTAEVDIATETNLANLTTTWGTDAAFNGATDYVLTNDGQKVLGNDVVSNVVDQVVEENHTTKYRIVGTTLECWGTTASGGTGKKTVTFPKYFSAEPSVTCTVRQGTSSNSGRMVMIMTGHGNNLLQTFVYQVRNDAGNAQSEDINWHAIGQYDGTS
jgi:hypothetical protein